MKPSEELIFELNPASTCGVLMKKNVMKKVVALQQEYESKLRKLLHAHEDELLPMAWTMSNRIYDLPVVYAKYADTGYCTSITDRIKRFKMDPPKRVDNYLECGHKEANRWCNREARRLRDLKK